MADSSFRLPGVASLAVAAVALGLALQAGNGEYTPRALALLTVALLATLFAVIGASPRSTLPDARSLDGGRQPSEEQSTVLLLFLGVVVQFIFLFAGWPSFDVPHGGRFQLFPFHLGLSAALLLLLIGAMKIRKSVNLLWFPALLAVSFLLGIWLIHSSPAPHIDVWMFQQGGAAALLRGHNPYLLTFPDIYHSSLPGHQRVYGTQLVVGDRVQFGPPYPPLSLLLATVGYAVAGDHRYAQAVALLLAGAFIGYSRSGNVPKFAAALFLFTPRIFFVLGRAWTEPFVVMLLAATCFVAARGVAGRGSRRSSWLLPVAFGLLLAEKQYMILALPLSFLLLAPGWRWRNWFQLLWQSLLVATAVTLPFAIGNFRAFWTAIVTVQQSSPFRWDALSYLVWYGLRGHPVTSPLLATVCFLCAVAVALALSLWRAARRPAGFAAALSLVSLAFFAFNKQAFCNYYFFVIGALCCAIACGKAPTGEPAGTPPSSLTHQSPTV